MHDLPRDAHDTEAVLESLTIPDWMVPNPKELLVQPALLDHAMGWPSHLAVLASEAHMDRWTSHGDCGLPMRPRKGTRPGVPTADR